MRLTDVFTHVVAYIDARLPIALQKSRLGLLTHDPTLIVLAGKDIKSEAASWYLSVLVSRESDEVSATLNVQARGDQIAVTADVCLEAAVLWEANSAFSTFGGTDEQILDSILADFVKQAPDSILAALREMSDGSEAPGS